MEQVKKLLLKKEFFNEEIAYMNAKISGIDAELLDIFSNTSFIQDSHIPSPKNDEVTNASVETAVLAEESIRKEEKYIIEMKCEDANKLIHISPIGIVGSCAHLGSYPTQKSLIYKPGSTTNARVTIHEVKRRGSLSLRHGNEDKGQFVLLFVIASAPLEIGNIYVHGSPAHVVCSGWHVPVHLPSAKKTDYWSIA